MGVGPRSWFRQSTDAGGGTKMQCRASDGSVFFSFLHGSESSDNSFSELSAFPGRSGPSAWSSSLTGAPAIGPSARAASSSAAFADLSAHAGEQCSASPAPRVGR